MTPASPKSCSESPNVARTGRMGDGKVFILPVSRFEQVIEA